MAVNIPAAVELHTSSSLGLARSLIGTPGGTGTKTAGNLPITSNASQFQANDPSPSTTDEGALFPFTSVDVSSQTKILVWSWQFNAPNRMQCRSLANEGVSAYIGSGAGSTDYKRFIIGGNDTPVASSQNGVNALVIDLNDTSNESSSGTFDNTDVQAYGLAVRREDLQGTGSNITFVQRAHIFDTEKDGTNIVKFTGTSDYDDIINAVLGSDYTNKIGGWVQKLSSSYFIPIAFQIGDTSTLTNFDDNGATIISPSSADASDPRYRYTTQGTRVYIVLRDNVADTCILSGTYKWGVASPWDLDVSNNSTITITGGNFSGMGDFTCGSSVTGTATFNLASGSTVNIKGANLDGSTINGDCNLQGSTVTTFTNIDVTGALDFDTAGTYSLVGCTINEVTNSSGGAVTLNLTGTTITTNTGPSITVNQNVIVESTGIIDGSKVQLYNVTKDVELDIATVSGGSGYSYTANLASINVDNGDTLRLRATYQNGANAKELLILTGIITTAGLSLLGTQIDAPLYNQFGNDGSLMSEFIWDGGNLEVDINDADNKTIIQRTGAWYYYFITTDDGIRDLAGCFKWEFYNQIQIDTDLCDIRLDNKKTEALFIEGGRLYRKDGTTIVSPTTTGQIFQVGGVGPSAGSGTTNLLVDPEVVGLTLLGKVYTLAGSQQGSDVTMTEQASGIYTGSYDLSSVPDGEYYVKFVAGGATYGDGKLFVRGNEEVSQESFFDPNFDIVQSVAASTNNLDLPSVEQNLTAEINENETKIDNIPILISASSKPYDNYDDEEPFT